MADFALSRDVTSASDRKNEVARRYDQLAPVYDWLIDRMLFRVPSGLRSLAVSRLRLRPGHRVLDVGCGTGLLFPHLRRALSGDGFVMGVEKSAGMLRKANERLEQHGWEYMFTLCNSDILELHKDRFDGAFFGLCLATMQNHEEVLRRVWNDLLKVGGRLVIMDAREPLKTGFFWKMVKPLAERHARIVAANMSVRPWEALQRIAGLDNVELEFAVLNRFHYIATATKQ